MSVRFVEFKVNDGFDATGVNPWQMVPMGGKKRVKLLGAKGMTVTVLPANGQVRATLHPDGSVEILSLTTVTNSFDGQVLAQDASGTTKAILDISVTKAVSISTAFFFVRDTAVPASGGNKAVPSHGTKRVMPGTGPNGKPIRGAADLDGLLKVVNSIFTPQTNVRFVQETGSPSSLVVAGNLGRTITDPGTWSGELAAITNGRTFTARFNVFLVWEIDGGDPNKDVDATTTLGGRFCAFEDNAGVEVGESLAHEAGHALGLTHVGHVRKHLMFPTTDTRGRKLTRANLLALRP